MEDPPSITTSTNVSYGFAHYVPGRSCPRNAHHLTLTIALGLFTGIGTGRLGCGLLKDLLHYEFRGDLLAGE